MTNIKGTAALGFMGAFLYFVTSLAQPIYERLWLQFITVYYPQITTQYLGFIVLTLAVVFLGIGMVSNTKKHPLQRPIFLVGFILLINMAINLIFPLWFYSYWRF